MLEKNRQEYLYLRTRFKERLEKKVEECKRAGKHDTTNGEYKYIYMVENLFAI